jgi:hypothetical protein
VSDSTAPLPPLKPEADGPVTPPFAPKENPDKPEENMPDIVRAALSEAVRKNMLGLHSSAVVLAHVVNIIRWRLWAGPRGGSPGLKQTDMDVLRRWARDSIWPAAWPVRQHGYAALVGNYTRMDDDEVARLKTKRAREIGLWFWQTKEDEERAIREHMRPLRTAAEPRERALELARPILDRPEIKGRDDFEVALVEIFCAQTGQSRESGCRFVAAMMPHITGESVHAAAIRQSVNRAIRQSVNRRSRKSRKQ